MERGESAQGGMHFNRQAGDGAAMQMCEAHPGARAVERLNHQAEGAQTARLCGSIYSVRYNPRASMYSHTASGT
jgi:hypothetical protein